jgi:hypothetical protein
MAQIRSILSNVTSVARRKANPKMRDSAAGMSCSNRSWSKAARAMRIAAAAKQTAEIQSVRSRSLRCDGVFSEMRIVGSDLAEILDWQTDYRI